MKRILLAVCVLASIHGCPIERREPTPAELADPNVAIPETLIWYAFRTHPDACSNALCLKEG